MDYKKEILKLLEILSNNGLTKPDIEKRLGYSPNYIGQIVSKGGNERVYKSLQKLLHNAKPDNSPIPTEITQLVNSNAILAESNKKLVDMLHSTAGFQKDKDLATSAMFRGLLDGMADVATGKEYNSKSEALRGLSKQIHEYVSAILIADNHGEKGKKHT